jgi:uncharacterized repeat protein (TIGR02059 family)
MSCLFRHVHRASILLVAIVVCLSSLLPQFTHAASPDDFVTTWNTDPYGWGETEFGFTITHGTADIDWDNDGLFDVFGQSGYVSHDFGTPGTYTIRLSHDLQGWTVSPVHALKLLSVDQWGTARWSNLSGAFQDAANMTITAVDAPDLSGVTNLSSLFSGATSFNAPIDHWNVSRVTNMSNLFFNASSFNQPLDSWDVRQVTDMSNLFAGASAFNNNISSWNTSQVTTMASMFANAVSFGSDIIPRWDTSRVTDMSNMFLGASAFNDDLSSWNTGAVTTLQGMFQGAASFQAPIGSWDVGQVTDMSSLFSGATSFNQPLDTWNTSSVTTMSNLFSGATAFNQSLNAWNTSRVTTMAYLFSAASNFNGAIGDWDVSGVTDFSGVFAGASSFNQPLQDWDVSQVTSFSILFTGAAAFNQPLDRWNTSNVLVMNDLFSGASSFNQPLDTWDVSHVTNMQSLFKDAVSFNQPLAGWDVRNVSVLASLFQGATTFNQPLSTWDTSNVTNMNQVFHNATAFNQSLASWNVSNVSTMIQMLSGTNTWCQNYSTTLQGWASRPVLPGVVFGASGRHFFLSALSARTALTSAPNNWIITDGGPGLCDSTPPLVISASVLGRTLTLQLDEPMDSSLPASSSFTVVVNEQVYHVTLVQVEGSQVRLTLNQPVGAGSTARISYTAPGVLPRLADLANHPLASFTNMSVSVPGVSGGTGQGLWEDEEPDSPEMTPESEPEDGSIHNPPSEELSEWPVLTKPHTLQPLGCRVVEPSGFWYDVAKTGLQSLGLTLPDRPLSGTVSVHEAVELLSTISTRASDTASALGLRPNRRLRRADAVQLLVELNRTDDRLTQREAVALARNQCILRGYPDGSLQLEQPINWAEFLTMLYRTVGGGR